MYKYTSKLATTFAIVVLMTDNYVCRNSGTNLLRTGLDFERRATCSAFKIILNAEQKLYVQGPVLAS
jgi:hypothetical protein